MNRRQRQEMKKIASSRRRVDSATREPETTVSPPLKPEQCKLPPKPSGTKFHLQPTARDKREKALGRWEEETTISCFYRGGKWFVAANNESFNESVEIDGLHRGIELLFNRYLKRNRTTTKESTSDRSV